MLQKIKSLQLKFALLLISLAVVASCKKKDSGAEEPANPFDKQGMLVNEADNVVLPCYTQFKISLDSLSSAFNAFKAAETITGFQLVKQRLHAAYLDYQHISLFGFGPGEDVSIRANFNVFPTKTANIDANITAGTYDLASLSNLSAKGFPALDYLFYGLNQSESDQMQLFSSNPNRKKYVSDVLNDMSQKVNAVIAGWNGTYRSTFINSLGTDVGSSIGFLVNQLNYELDYLKNSKMAIPLGLKSGGTLLPANCEAYYGGQSLPYVVETLNAIENMYLGRSRSGQDGKGFDDYLDHLNIAYPGGTLNAAIKAQFLLAKTKLNEVGNPLSDQVVTNYNTVNTAYKELVKLLVLLKTDMPSNLGVVITYQDGDGD